MNRVLYVIACAAPPAADVAQLATLASERGWDVCVLTTPYGRRFVDPAALEELTGYPVRSDYKHPGEPGVLPPADAIIVAPATVNTISKWAAGICDTLPLGILTEAIGAGLPVVAVPVSSRAHAAHPVLAQNVARLRSWGVTVLDDVLAAEAAPDLDNAGQPEAGRPEAGQPDMSQPAQADRVWSGAAGLDWPAVLAAVEAAGRRRATGATRRYEHWFRDPGTGPAGAPGPGTKLEPPLASVHDIGSAPSAGRSQPGSLSRRVR